MRRGVRIVTGESFLGYTQNAKNCKVDGGRSVVEAAVRGHLNEYVTIVNRKLPVSKGSVAKIEVGGLRLEAIDDRRVDNVLGLKAVCEHWAFVQPVGEKGDLAVYFFTTGYGSPDPRGLVKIQPKEGYIYTSAAQEAHLGYLYTMGANMKNTPTGLSNLQCVSPPVILSARCDTAGSDGLFLPAEQLLGELERGSLARFPNPTMVSTFAEHLGTSKFRGWFLESLDRVAPRFSDLTDPAHYGTLARAARFQPELLRASAKGEVGLPDFYKQLGASDYYNARVDAIRAANRSVDINKLAEEFAQLASSSEKLERRGLLPPLPDDGAS